MPPTSGGFVVENFAFLPHRAEAHTTVLSKSVGRAFRAVLMLVTSYQQRPPSDNGAKVVLVGS
jgi:hypothetical protein